MSIVLMYHALYPDHDVSAIDAEDLPYAVSLSTFKAHMALLAELNVGLLSENAHDAQPDVVITFDDGHISNHSLALPILQKFGFPAYFFVTTNFIKSRHNHCRVQQLRELSDAGMVVGSHGVSHRFLADLSDDDVMQELIHSREQLQQWLDAEVSCFSFPGGRYTQNTLNAARDAGYRQMFNSEFDAVSAANIVRQQPLARVAIRRNTTTDSFKRMINHDVAYYRRVQLLQRLKQSVKGLLGNRLYHGLYKSLTTR